MSKKQLLIGLLFWGLVMDFATFGFLLVCAAVLWIVFMFVREM